MMVFRKRNIPWNKGLTKDTDKRVYLNGKSIWENDERKRNISKGLAGHSVLKKTRDKIRKFMKKRHHSKKTEFKRGCKPVITEIRNKKISEALSGQHHSVKTEFKKGKEHPNWQGGISFEPYDKSFNNKFKRAIRKRDNYVCMKCGIHQEKCARALNVHHINYDKYSSIPQNCISLCGKCHSEVNFNRKHWTIFFQSLLNERYECQYLNGEVVLSFN